MEVDLLKPTVDRGQLHFQAAAASAAVRMDVVECRPRSTVGLSKSTSIHSVYISSLLLLEVIYVLYICRTS